MTAAEHVDRALQWLVAADYVHASQDAGVALGVETAAAALAGHYATMATAHFLAADALRHAAAAWKRSVAE